MEFCPKCGCVLVEKKKDFGCPRCNYKAKSKVKIEASENIEKKPEIGVITSEDTDVFPVTNATCPKCDNKEAVRGASEFSGAPHKCSFALFLD